jgi:hypothetical protein
MLTRRARDRALAPPLRHRDQRDQRDQLKARSSLVSTIWPPMWAMAKIVAGAVGAHDGSAGRAHW